MVSPWQLNKRASMRRRLSTPSSPIQLVMAVANQLIAAPSDWVAQLADVAVAVAHAKNIPTPTEFASRAPSSVAAAIAASLLDGEPRAVK